MVQALKAYGEERITPELIAEFRRVLPPETRKKILRDTVKATGWVYAAIRDIVKHPADA